MTFKEINPEDFEKVVDLLAESELDISDLKQPCIRLFQIGENGQIAGVGGLEIYGDQALLRSVAVRKEFQGQGIGKKLVRQVEEVAIQSGIKSLYLLTTTASVFFNHWATYRLTATILLSHLKIPLSSPDFARQVLFA